MPVLPFELVTHLQHFLSLAWLHGQPCFADHGATVQLDCRPKTEAKGGVAPLLAFQPGAHIRLAKIMVISVHDAPVLQKFPQVLQVILRQLSQKQTVCAQYLLHISCRTRC